MGMSIENIQQGWQCPLCKRVYSPTTVMCLYCGEEGATKIYTTTRATSAKIIFDWDKGVENGNDD